MTGQLPPSNPEAFFVAGEKANLLMIHGYTATAYDFRYISSILAKRGFGVFAPLLFGHGSNPELINEAKAEQWLNDARQTWEKMPADKPKFIAGTSMGGLIATILASENPETTQGLVLMAPAFQLRPLNRLGVFLAKCGMYHLLKFIKKTNGPCDTADPVAKRYSPAYLVTPVKGLLQLDILKRRALLAAKKISCPIFAIFGAQDGTVDSGAAEKLLKKASTVSVKSFTLGHSRHVLPLDVDRDELAQLIGDFCEKVIEPTPRK